MLFVGEEKDFNRKFTLLSLAETPVDQLVAISHVSTYWHKQNVSSKIRVYSQHIAWYAVFKAPVFANPRDNFLLKHRSIYRQLPIYVWSKI